MEEETVQLETESFSEMEQNMELEEQNAVSETSGSLDDSINNTTKEDSPTKTNKPIKYLKLPFAKVKHIMKMDPDVALVQEDAVFLVAKATEMFLEYISKETNKQLAGQKRKTVMKRDVDATIETISQLCFLDGALE